MAYEGYEGTIYSSLSGSGFTSACLEGIPFKIGPKFKPPTRVVLPPDFDIRTAAPRSSVLNDEYTFEVEEAVLKWSAEREKQKEERLELQRQATLRKSQESSSSESHADLEETDGVDQSEPLYENAGILHPKPAPRPRPKPASNYATVTIPNSLIANISNDILQPTPIQSANNKENGSTVEADKNVSSKSDIDLSWFEKQDDPFDNLELKTINDMEELASVLQNSSNASQNIDHDLKNTKDNEELAPSSSSVNQNLGETNLETVYNETDNDNVRNNEVDDDEHFYENVNLIPIKNGPVKTASSPNSSILDLSKLPPVPPRRDLVGRPSPLPPIGQSTDIASSNPPINSVVNPVTSQKSVSPNSATQSVTNNSNKDLPFQSTDLTKASTINHKAPVKKPPRTFKYSRHVDPDTNTINNTPVEQSNSGSIEQSNQISSSFSEGNVSVQFKNTQSHSDNEDIELRFDSDHFGDKSNSRPVPAPRRSVSPPPRPSSGQLWNRYSPLPPTHVPVDQPQPATVALPVISSGAESPLSHEAQTAVSNLVGMGFPKDRVVRAVEKLGEDEKEIVEFLCLVDQLIEKGYSSQLAETALLMFRNSMNQASSFLELFTQFQELGFSGDKIKEALVNTNNDREKTLDILTASS